MHYTCDSDVPKSIPIRGRCQRYLRTCSSNNLLPDLSLYGPWYKRSVSISFFLEDDQGFFLEKLFLEDRRQKSRALTLKGYKLSCGL